MEYIETTKGKRKLVHDGYYYVKQKQLASGAINWECEKRRGKGTGINSSQCKAKLQILNDVILKETHEHSHAPDVTRAEVLRTKNAIKRQATGTQDTAQQIITAVAQGISQEVATQLPHIRSIRRGIRRKRQGDAPAMPADRASIQIPDKYKNLPTGERFLQYDSGATDNRILIFATDNSLQLLSSSDHWFMDGTFKIAPELFFQLYTVHVLHNCSTVACVYALLPRKEEATYEELFREIKIIAPQAAPVSIMVDFEKAAMNAALREFQGVQVKGCFFHLSQNVYRHVQDSGQQRRYLDDLDFSLGVRMISALAFVPVDKIVESFEALQQHLGADFDDALDYFEDNYIGRQRRTNRRPPRFAHQLWNMNSRADEELPKTNNHVEGWHRRMRSAVNSCHPSIWKLIEILQRDYELGAVAIAQAVGGHSLEPRRRKYVECERRITAIVRDYPARQTLDFLRAIAYNLKL